MAMQLPSSSSSSVSNDFTYDVFISFRGTDTRYGFTGNLYKALSDKGIRTFIDDEELPRGDEITPSLLKSIEDSRIAIIVFSKDYASSSFCLDELAHIIHYFKKNGRLVLPVFYDAEPSHVRHQNGGYGEALAKHHKKSMDRLLKWKKALSEAANLSGYHFKPGAEYEHKFIEKIVKDVSNKINHVPLYLADYLVGLKSRISEVNSLLDLGCTDGVCIIGIVGTGGLGKTTLAQAVYNLIADQFESFCFLHNVRENSLKHGLEYLQEQLLSKSIGFETNFGHVNEGIPIIRRRLCKKKVLLILDDVDKKEQLQVLVGESGWLGHGSRVIITTRDKYLLSSHGIKKIYEADGLNKEQALELLRMMAFKSNKNDSSYDSILNRAAKYASGLPLALEVVGSNLFGKSVEECESLLDKYERIPHKDILKTLKVSFDALDDDQKSVFLDIACFFKGFTLACIEEELQCRYDHCIKIDLKVLVEKSLIKIDNVYSEDETNVRLHDLIEDMGKEIVRQESPNKPGERSRLWFKDDIIKVLKEDMGTENIEMIYLNCPSMDNVIDWNGKAFKKMTNLKTLMIKNGHFSKGIKYLPSSLIVLKMNGCLSESLSSSIFNKKFQNMKVLTLAHCEYLTHIPDVSGLSNLKKFTCYFCRNLITIDDSIGPQNTLEFVDATGCEKLESFPPLWLVSLKELNLTYCDSLSIRELLWKMTNVKEIELNDNSIEELPFQNLSEFGRLLPWECGMLMFPKHNDKMYSNVEYLNLQGANLSDECLPILITLCANVKVLNLSKNNFKILPECLSECHLLRNLSVEGCSYLEEIRGIPPNLNYLDAMRCESLSSSTRRMLLSQKLHEAGCTNIRLSNVSEGIPDWFEHKIRGHTISFWFRKKIPSITSIILFSGNGVIPYTDLFVNGYSYNYCDGGFIYDYLFCGADVITNLDSTHAFLFDLKLEEQIKHYKTTQGNLVSEIDKALLENQWIHVELSLVVKLWCFGEDMIKISRSAEMGIHVLKDKVNTVEDVIFTNPYPYRKRKLAEYLNASLSQKKRKQTKFSIPMDLVSGMQNLVLTETNEEEHQG